MEDEIFPSTVVAKWYKQHLYQILHCQVAGLRIEVPGTAIGSGGWPLESKLDRNRVCWTWIQPWLFPQHDSFWKFVWKGCLGEMGLLRTSTNNIATLPVSYKMQVNMQRLWMNNNFQSCFTSVCYYILLETKWNRRNVWIMKLCVRGMYQVQQSRQVKMIVHIIDLFVWGNTPVNGS